MIKLVVTDVDGTIVQESVGGLNPEYFDVIRKLHKQGIKVVIASGRSYSSLYNLFKPVEDIVWFVADGGTAIKTTGELEIVSKIPNDIAQELLEDVLNIPDDKTDIIYCGEKKVYSPDETTEMYAKLRDEYKMNLEVFDKKVPDDSCLKIAVYHPENIEKLAKEYILPKWKGKLHVVISGEWWCDCIPFGANKATALQIILDRLGIDKENVLATGDNMNDYEMIELAGTAYAVSTAREELKAIADKVIDNYENHGVLNEWKKLLK